MLSLAGSLTKNSEHTAKHEPGCHRSYPVLPLNDGNADANSRYEYKIKFKNKTEQNRVLECRVIASTNTVRTRIHLRTNGAVVRACQLHGSVQIRQDAGLDYLALRETERQMGMLQDLHSARIASSKSCAGVEG